MRTLKFLILLPLLLYMFSCQREGFITDPNAKLNFSLDTVYFDTVFTSIGTVTRRFTVKNPYKESIKISSAQLAGGDASVYRINFDGLSGTQFENIEIAPKDSLFIFVKATLDPNNSNGILLQKDSIVFTTNHNTQDIDLVAWGQDVHILRDTVINSQTWTADKPYLIIGQAILDSAQILTIEAGSKIYFHRDSYLWIAGTLLVNGEKENTVSFSGDRLEQMYYDIPGQWTGLVFHPWSHGNKINYAEIRGGLVGMVLQSTFDDVFKVDLEITNTKIQHVSSYGIRAAYSKIIASNNLITNCGISAVALEGGGNYEFYHTTIANWFGFNSRKTPSVIMTNYAILSYEDGSKSEEIRDLEKAKFGNCIIYGDYSNEIVWSKSDTEDKQLNYTFENCLIKVDTSETPLTGDSHFTNCINYKDPMFLNLNLEGDEVYDFHFDTLENRISPARNLGNPSIGGLFPLDLDENSRTADGQPDAGAYEFLLP